MANTCPVCDGELVRSSTKKKGMDTLKHKDPAAAKAAGCGMTFIPVRGAAKNADEKETVKNKEISGARSKGGNEESGSSGGGYLEAVRRYSAGKRGKNSGRSNREGAEHVPERRAAAARGGREADQPARGATKRSWLDDVTDTIFRK